jgi:hypothetical protein
MVLSPRPYLSRVSCHQGFLNPYQMMVMITLLIRSSFTVDTDTLSSMWTPQKAVNHVSHLSSSMLHGFFCHLLYTV